MKNDFNQQLNAARLARCVVASIVAGALFTASALTSRDSEKSASPNHQAQAAASPTQESTTNNRLNSWSPQPASFRFDAVEHHD